MTNYADMPLTSIIQAYLDENGWEDEIAIDDQRNFSSMGTTVGVHGQGCRLYIDAYEDRQQVLVYLYTPFNVPAQRIGEVARILNIINDRIGFGRVTCADDGEANPIRFKVGIDVEGGAIVTQQISTMVAFATGTFNEYLDVLSAAALTKMKAVDVWSQYLSEKQGEEE